MTDTPDNTGAKPYTGDLAKTQILDEMFRVPPEQRDDVWKNKFLENVTDASFACGTPQVLVGPDGFPYFQLQIPEPNKEFQCFVIRHMIGDFLLEKGLGVVIKTAGGEVNWVFSYGDLLNFHLNREFYTESAGTNGPKEEVVGKDEPVLIGQPSEALVPAVARTVIRHFLKNLGVENIQLLLMNRQKPDGPSQELVFNITPDKFQNNEIYERAMTCVSWCLPRHYRFVAMDESSLKESFQPL